MWIQGQISTEEEEEEEEEEVILRLHFTETESETGEWLEMRRAAITHYTLSSFATDASWTQVS